MSTNRCARCGRERSQSVLRRIDGLSQTPAPGEPEGPWAWIYGADVCPECQTPDERHDVARRVASMIEREITRRQDGGIPPDEHEAPLTGFAMDQRATVNSAGTPAAGGTADPGRARSRTGGAAHGAVEGSSTSPPPELAATAARAHDADEGPRLQVIVTGALLTRHPLDVSISNYADLRARLGTRLRGINWQTEDLHVSDGSYATAGGGGFAEEIPLVVARWNGFKHLPRLSAAVQESGHGRGGGSDDVHHVTDSRPKALVIDIYDLGVAVVTATFDVPRSTRAELDVTARALKQLVSLRLDDGRPAPVAEALQRIVDKTMKKYGEAVEEVAPDELQAGRWRSGTTPDRTEPPVDVLHKDYGRLLWLHPVHLLTPVRALEPSGGPISGTGTGTGTDQEALAARDLRALAPTFHRTIELEGGIFAPGIGASAVVAEPASDAEHVPLRLIKLHWAYYALYIGIDRNLLGVLESERWKRSSKLKELEADADNVFADHQRVMDARGRLDSQLTALGGDELAVWDEIATVQRFDSVVAAVDRKLETLEKLAERRVALATTERARHIEKVLVGLTALTVVSLTAALVALILGEGDPDWDPWWVSVVCILVGFAVAAVIYLAAVRREVRDPGGRPRRRSR